MSTELIVPSLERLPAYVQALQSGWSPDNLRGLEHSAAMRYRIPLETA